MKTLKHRYQTFDNEIKILNDFDLFWPKVIYFVRSSCNISCLNAIVRLKKIIKFNRPLLIFIRRSLIFCLHEFDNILFAHGTFRFYDTVFDCFDRDSIYLLDLPHYPTGAARMLV